MPFFFFSTATMSLLLFGGSARVSSPKRPSASLFPVSKKQTTQASTIISFGADLSTKRPTTPKTFSSSSSLFHAQRSTQTRPDDDANNTYTEMFGASIGKGGEGGLFGDHHLQKKKKHDMPSGDLDMKRIVDATRRRKEKEYLKTSGGGNNNNNNNNNNNKRGPSTFSMSLSSSSSSSSSSSCKGTFNKRLIPQDKEALVGNHAARAGIFRWISGYVDSSRCVNPTAFEEYAIAQLHGPPGTGKSSAMYIIAHTLGIDLHIINCSRDRNEKKHFRRGARIFVSSRYAHGEERRTNDI